MSPHLNLNSPLIRIPDYQSNWVLLLTTAGLHPQTDRVVDSGMWENQLDKDLEYKKKSTWVANAILGYQEVMS